MALATGLKLSIKRIKAKIAAVVETGLATWHKMTANTWTGANRLPDDSTNSNTAALYTGLGLSFDGVNDVVAVGDTGQIVKTVVFYAYPDSTTTAFMQLQASGAVRVEIASGTLSATGFTSPTLYVNGAAGSTVAATTWQQLAVTSATGVSASNVLLGQSNTSYYGGDFSNVKFFSVELSAVQIAELYANPEQVLPTGVIQSELVCWWPMADGNTTNIILGGNNSKTGIITGATAIFFIQNSAPQFSLVGNNRRMWFDGSNDYVEILSDAKGSLFDTQNFTIIAKGLTPLTDANMTIWSYDFTSHTPPYYAQHLRFATTGRLFFYWNDGTIFQLLQANHGLSANDPFLIEAHYESGLQYIKLNGVTIASSNSNAVITFYNQELWIGKANFTAYYNGFLESVQFYSNGNLISNYVNNGNTNNGWIDLNGNYNGTVNGSPGSIYIPQGINVDTDLLNTSLKNKNNGEIILINNGYALVTDAATLDITTAITLEAWVKPFTVSTDQTIIGKNTAYALGLTSAGKPVFTKWTSAASTATATTTTALTVNTWYHIAVTYDGTNVKIYIDGAIDTTTAVGGAIDSTSTDVLMGALTTSTELFSGYIDSVKIYSSDLTAAQVAENYNAETAAHSNA